MPNACRIGVTESGCRLTFSPPPPKELVLLLWWVCRSRGWSLNSAGEPPSEVVVDGPAPAQLAEALRGEPAFDYAVTVA